MEFRIYVACLASYSAGKLHGAWLNIDADSDVESLQAQIGAMLKASPVGGAEEWAIHDVECPVADVDTWSLDDLCALARLCAQHGLDVVQAARSISYDLDETERYVEDRYRGAFNHPGDYAEQLADDCGMLAGFSENLRGYFDFEKFERDMELSGEITIVAGDNGALHVFDNLN